MVYSNSRSHLSKSFLIVLLEQDAKGKWKSKVRVTVGNGFEQISSTKPWSAELDPVTAASDPQELFPPKPKPKPGILPLRRFKIESLW